MFVRTMATKRQAAFDVLQRGPSPWYVFNLNQGYVLVKQEQRGMDVLINNVRGPEQQYNGRCGILQTTTERGMVTVAVDGNIISMKSKSMKCLRPFPYRTVTAEMMLTRYSRAEACEYLNLCLECYDPEWTREEADSLTSMLHKLQDFMSGRWIVPLNPWKRNQTQARQQTVVDMLRTPLRV